MAFMLRGRFGNSDVGIEFKWCPAGTFQMGDPSSSLPFQVTLTKGFWMGVYPVTQAQWFCVMGNNPSYFEGLDNPVEQVSWFDCKDFCREAYCFDVGKGYRMRLPTEAEWEYACRAGTTSAYYSNNEENGWYISRDKSLWGTGYQLPDIGTHPVGQKQPNAWGLYDMLGNVCEWCEDWFIHDGKTSVTDPHGDSKSPLRAIRGGSWASYAKTCCPGYKNGYAPTRFFNNVGFRVVLDA